MTACSHGLDTAEPTPWKAGITAIAHNAATTAGTTEAAEMTWLVVKGRQRTSPLLRVSTRRLVGHDDDADVLSAEAEHRIDVLRDLFLT